MRSLLYTTALLLTVAIFFVAMRSDVAFAAEVKVSSSYGIGSTANMKSAPGLVCVTDQKCYVFFINSSNALHMATSTNGGITWSASILVDSVNTADTISYGIWWDGWTPPGTTTQYIHVVTVDTSVDDTYYTRVDTTNDSRSATALATTQAATCTNGSSCYPAITKTSDGTLYMANADTSDSWIVRCTTTCTTAGNWSELTGGWPTLGDDIALLAPAPGNNNLLFIHWDITADDVIAKEYSATATAWVSTTTLNAAAEDNLTYDAQLMGISISTSTGRIGLVHTDDTNDYTTQDHDIDFWTYATTTGWVQGTDPVSNASGGITAARLSFDQLNDVWYTIYSRRSTIGQSSSTLIYYATSSNGSAWTSEIGPVGTTSTGIHTIDTIDAQITSFERIGVAYGFGTTTFNAVYYSDIVDIQPPSVPEDSPPFSENFEDGGALPGEFDSEDSYATGDFALDSTSKVHGTYSARCDVPANDDGCILTETITSTTSVYAQFSILLDAGFTVGATGYMGLFEFNDGVGRPIYCNLEDYGTIRLTCDGDEAPYMNTGIDITPNVATRLEFRVTASSTGGVLQIWKDNGVEGSPDFSTTTINTGTDSIVEMAIGGYHPDTVADKWYDDICIQGAFMGDNCYSLAVGGTETSPDDGIIWFMGMVPFIRKKKHTPPV